MGGSWSDSPPVCAGTVYEHMHEDQQNLNRELIHISILYTQLINRAYCDLVCHFVLTVPMNIFGASSHFVLSSYSYNVPCADLP